MTVDQIVEATSDQSQDWSYPQTAEIAVDPSTMLTVTRIAILVVVQTANLAVDQIAALAVGRTANLAARTASQATIHTVELLEGNHHLVEATYQCACELRYALVGQFAVEHRTGPVYHMAVDH